MYYRFDITTTDEPQYLSFGNDEAADAYAEALDGLGLYAGHSRHTHNL